MKPVYASLAVLALVAGFAPSASADVVALSFSSVTNYGYNGNNAPTSTGFSFTPTQNLTLTALGYYQVDSSAFPGLPNVSVHPVSVYSGNYTPGTSSYAGSGTLVASATTTPGTAGTYSWQALDQGPSVTLLAGTTYTLSANAYNSVADATDNRGGNDGPGYHADTSVPTIVTGLSFMDGLGYINGTAGAGGGFQNSTAFLHLESWDPTNTYSSGDPSDLSPHYDPSYIGFFAGNMQFAATAPEPASLGMLLLGITGLLVRRKK